MAANKATGPDGIPAEFYTQFEYLILARLHAVLTEAAERGWLDENMREGDIILLYKKKRRATGPQLPTNHPPPNGLQNILQINGSTHENSM